MFSDGVEVVSEGRDSAGTSGGGMTTVWFAANELILASAAPFAADVEIAVSVVMAGNDSSFGAGSTRGGFSAMGSAGSDGLESREVVSMEVELLQEIQ